MKRLVVAFGAAALAAVVGCNTSPPGGPGADTHPSARVSRYGPVDTGSTGTEAGKAQFTLSGPGGLAKLLPTAVKQGEKKEITISVNRESGFNQDVRLKFTAPKGVTVTPADPVIKAGDKDVMVFIEAAKDAPPGEQTINVTGVPKSGSETTLQVPVNIEKS
jgi:hypothetical protein